MGIQTYKHTHKDTHTHINGMIIHISRNVWHAQIFHRLNTTHYLCAYSFSNHPKFTNFHCACHRHWKGAMYICFLSFDERFWVFEHLQLIGRVRVCERGIFFFFDLNEVLACVCLCVYEIWISDEKLSINGAVIMGHYHHHHNYQQQQN